MLARKGIPCTILEKRTVLDEVGAGIQLSPNVTRLLIDIGLGQEILRNACTPERVIMRSFKTGAILGEMALGNDNDERYQAPYWLTARADLHMVLLDAIRMMPNIKLQVGSQITEARSFPDAVAAVMRRQGGAIDDMLTPLLVGADGQWSPSRKFMGDLRTPRFQKYMAWRALVPMNHMPTTASLNEVCVWLGDNRHVVHYPVKSGKMLNIVVVTREHVPPHSDEELNWSHTGSIDALAMRMSDGAFALRELLAVPPAWRIWPLYDLPVRRMSNGRIALVGDAAHPVLPFQAQGAAMAIEDAACLAEAISAEPDDIIGSLNAYERLRLKRVKRVQQVSRRNGMLFHASMPLAFLRNSILAMRNGQDMLQRMDWLYDWRLTMR